MLGATACTGSAPRADGAEGARTEPAHIVTVHVSKCGACHAPVEPGTRSREDIERALARHQKRLRLSPDEWSAMVDYLAVRGPIR
jgi:hypothetical protein